MAAVSENIRIFTSSNQTITRTALEAVRLPGPRGLRGGGWVLGWRLNSCLRGTCKLFQSLFATVGGPNIPKIFIMRYSGGTLFCYNQR